METKQHATKNQWVNELRYALRKTNNENTTNYTKSMQ